MNNIRELECPNCLVAIEIIGAEKFGVVACYNCGSKYEIGENELVPVGSNPKSQNILLNKEAKTTEKVCSKCQNLKQNKAAKKGIGNYICIEHGYNIANIHLHTCDDFLRKY